MWTEKYKPRRLDEVVGHDKLKAVIRKCIEMGDIPHLLFTGPPGIGKTLIAELIGQELLGELFNDNFIEINASDDRTVQKMREIVINAINHTTINGYMRIILLDEMDGVLEPAQELLRRPMEKSHKTRFILTANDESSIIEPIKNRCMWFDFRPLRKEDIIKRLNFIARNEKVKITTTQLEQIAKNSKGSMRQAIIELEKMSMMGEADEDILKKFMRR